MKSVGCEIFVSDKITTALAYAECRSADVEHKCRDRRLMIIWHMKGEYLLVPGTDQETNHRAITLNYALTLADMYVVAECT